MNNSQLNEARLNLSRKHSKINFDIKVHVTGKGSVFHFDITTL